jgi:hypothetical protein
MGRLAVTVANETKFAKLVSGAAQYLGYTPKVINHATGEEVDNPLTKQQFVENYMKTHLLDMAKRSFADSAAEAERRRIEKEVEDDIVFS